MNWIVLFPDRTTQNWDNEDYGRHQHRRRTMLTRHSLGVGWTNDQK